MRLLALPSTLLALLPAIVFGDVEFTVPIAGADVDVGTINVNWTESGHAPPITSLMAYTLLLMTGGDEEDNMASTRSCEICTKYDAQHLTRFLSIARIVNLCVARELRLRQ
jgi:hypothetical protein